jgi:hypothetical protein
MLPYMTHSGLAMSYLDNGSTLRSMFRLMPPQRHDADPDRSEVLAYIRENLRCELGRAIRAFNSMRNKKSQVIVYDMVHRQWRGCDWVPPEDEDKVSLLLRTINELKRDVAYLKTSVKKHERLFGQLERKRSRKREEQDEPDSEVEAQEEKSSPDVDPEELERKKREEEEAANRKAYNDYWGPIRAALAADQEASAPSVSPRSSPSDSTAPTQSPWENAEDEVS